MRTHFSPVFSSALAALSLAFSTGTAQIKRSVKVLESPDAMPYNIGDPDFKLENGYTGERRWVAFASHDGAPTFSRPAGISRQQTLKFMQPCYVIGQRGDYLKLAKYNPRLASRRFMPRRVANWKEVEYLGWIHRTQVMPYRVALKNSESKNFIKYITALSGSQVFEMPQAFFQNDSLKVFGRPDMMGPTRRPLPINTLLYAYKLSADRKFYLVGKSPQCSPDSADKIILGWMPVQTVQPWGEKAFVEVPHGVRLLAEGTAVPAVNMLAKSATAPGSRSQSARTPSVDGPTGYGQSFSPDGGAATGTTADQWVAVSLADTVLNLYPKPAQSLMPVYAVNRGRNGAATVRTAALSNVLDARNNRVFNILGQPLTHSRYQNLKGSMRRLNVVFLVDGAASSADFSAPVMTVLQQLQLRLDTTTQFDAVRYAGVLHREESGGECLPVSTLPLTRSYTALSGFFERGLERTRECGGYGSNVYGGLPRATSLLAGHEDESNIVIVIGSSAPSSANAYNWNTLVNGLTMVNARLLVYQTHSEASTAYNDYVIDAKKLIVASADNIGELRKEMLVEAPKATSVADFRLATGEQNAFVLDYPAASRWQGGVVFPAKLGAMPLLSLNASLDTLLRQVHDDNTTTMAALDRVFESYAGNIGTRVDARMEPAFGQYTEALPDATLRHFRKNLDVFRFAAVLPMEDTVAVRRGLLLSKDEFDQYMDIMSAAVLVLDAPANDRRKTGRLLKRQAKAYVNATGMKKPMPYRRMTVADAFALPTGLAVKEPALRRVRLKRLGKVSDADYLAVQSVVIGFHTDLKRRAAADALPKIPVAAGAPSALWVVEPL